MFEEVLSHFPSGIEVESPEQFFSFHDALAGKLNLFKVEETIGSCHCNVMFSICLD
jgi:hypothetical protein